ncbi:hypothetical protein SAMN05421541_114205 [Actinoplanes philippinensis]|uniref:Uncharacterized protein n=1 Tax=Actinoplanes philippinensis TaxID=35752 RepID=A0A1I2K3X0_9ACTN|nr:hypothetical protein [Actinoplanes philippinensis]SFF59761.1 hypothetical protein SAMN05421541_114205 [Actinoplanes philippinensis]
MLLAGALLPERAAVLALPAGLAYTTGVLTTSAFSYVARGEIGMPSMIGAVVSGVMAAILTRRPTAELARSVKVGQASPNS